MSKTILHHRQKLFLMFSGGNYRAIIAFCRTLTAMNVDFAIIARMDTDLILKTQYKTKVSAIRSTHKLDYGDIARCINETREKTKAVSFVICPTSEFLNIFLLRNSSFFETQRCEIPLVDLETYETISNKYSFSKLCKGHGIQIPKQFVEYQKLNFPFVAKPIRNINTTNKSLYPYLIYGETDLKAFENTENPNDFYYEEYVSGESHYLLLYFSKKGDHYKFSQQNLLQQADGKSIVMACPSYIHQLSVADKFEQMLKKINFHGLAMVELKLCNGEPIAIELNPRFWGPSQLFVDADNNIFAAFIADYVLDGQGSPVQTTKNNVIYLWFNGILFNFFAGKKLKWHINPPRFKINFILRYFFQDVYFRPDTFRLFWYELYQAISKSNY